MAAASLTPLATRIVDQLPILLEHLREHEADNDSLTRKYIELEQAVRHLKESIDNEVFSQMYVKRRIEEKCPGASGYGKKRPRDEDDAAEDIIKAMGRPRLHPKEGKNREAKRASSKESFSSIVSMTSKRRGRVFSEEEAAAITVKRMRYSRDA